LVVCCILLCLIWCLKDPFLGRGIQLHTKAAPGAGMSKQIFQDIIGTRSQFLNSTPHLVGSGDRGLDATLLGLSLCMRLQPDTPYFAPYLTPYFTPYLTPYLQPDTPSFRAISGTRLQPYTPYFTPCFTPYSTPYLTPYLQPDTPFFRAISWHALTVIPTLLHTLLHTLFYTLLHTLLHTLLYATLLHFLEAVLLHDMLLF